MKILPQKTPSASILLVVMIFTLCFAAWLASHLIMVSDEHLLVGRSQNWNDSLALAESGIEEGMQELNSGFTPVANGWTPTLITNVDGDLLGASFVCATRILNGGSYSVRITTNSVANPPYKATIVSVGTTVAPVTGQTINRKVEVSATTVPRFPVALGATGNINMNGNTIAASSWDSTDPSESTNGLFNGYTGTNGSIASVGGIVNIGNDTIDGNLYLGPNATYSGSGTVTGTTYNDYNVQYPPITLPTTQSDGTPITWSSVDPTKNGGTNWITTSGYYVINNSNPIYVAPGVTATFDVKESIFNPASVTIGGGTTDPGTIIMYQESGSMTLGGNSTGGAIGARPVNFQYYGMSGVTSITLAGTSTFVGTVYAPSATLTLNGGGNSNDFEGAAIVQSAVIDGHYRFHYDKSLIDSSAIAGYTAYSWQEL
ncbi:MAG: hypothetical protein KGJ88_05645 [Verrucomicrobiota bacterium]|nr:hypothetical protein [Verrucomicrobiota bacterium]